MFSLPNFNLADILTFYKVIRIKTENGTLLPLVCVSNEESRSWAAPQHPTDKNTKFSDTLWVEPKKISLTGYVPAKRWEEFNQLISGGDNAERGLYNSIARNIFGSRTSDMKNGNIGAYEVTLLGGVYDNMALIGFTRSETADVNSGYSVTLDFQEVLKVTPFTSLLTPEQVKVAQDTSTTELGQQTPRPNNSMLHDGLRS